MVDSTLPLPLDPPAASGAAAAPDGVPAAPRERHELPILFTGTGSEYFRIWVVNLLLTLVTLGLYYPWAKVRRLRYFYTNTSIGGHALDFHGDPARMLRGFLLVGAMALLYSVAGKVSPIAGLIALLIVAAVWPALFRAGQQFRLANTSWRGLRFRFDGDLAGAYRAMLPLFLPAAVTVIGVAATGGDDARHQGAAAIAGLALLAVMLLLPLLFWNLKKYQHGHFGLGQITTELRTGPGSFYWLALKVIGIAIAAALLVGAAVLAIGGFATLSAVFGGSQCDGGQCASRGSGTSLGVAAVFFVVVLLFSFYLSMLVVVVPYATAGVQNLVWGRTRSRLIKFDSQLRFWPLFRLSFLNLLLVLVTLGLYLPFAKIAMTRLRLGAVSVLSLMSPDELADTLRDRANDATGDAAGDLFGFDIGL